MADVRALLKAKRDQVQISHPNAVYTSSGQQLRCNICDTNIKNSTSWEGHLGSKSHRTNVARQREERAMAERSRFTEEDAAQPVFKKRKTDVDRESEAKPVPPPSNDIAVESYPPPSKLVSRLNGTLSSVSNLDEELLQFRRAVLDSDPSEAFARATVAAEPVLAPVETQGLPLKDRDQITDTQPTDRSEAEEAKRKELLDRELVVDRLLDEERAQEDADAKAVMMRAKIEALRKKKELARLQKASRRLN